MGSGLRPSESESSTMALAFPFLLPFGAKALALIAKESLSC